MPVALARVASVLAWRSGAAWFGPTERIMSTLAVLATTASALAIVRDDVRVRVALGVLLLLGTPALRVGELLGYELVYITWDHGPVASIVSVVVSITIFGLLGRKVWGRWIALGGSLAGLGGSLLNGLGSLAEPGLYTWAHACTTAGCATLVLLLGGPSMREAFEGRRDESLWRSPDPVVRALRWALLATLVSAPMLLVYALTQPVVPDTVGVAWALVGVQLLATWLCLRRKLIGALLLSLAGAALLVFTVACVVAMRLDSNWPIVGYYAVFWLPAGVTSVIAGAVMLRPLQALLTRT